jgi:hypothetical protein
VSDRTFNKRFDKCRALMDAHGMHCAVREFFGFDKYEDRDKVIAAVEAANWLDGPYSEVIFLAKVKRGL